MTTQKTDKDTTEILSEVRQEIERVDQIHGRTYASLHEAYGVLKEEVEEFFDEVRKKEENRNSEDIKEELIQIAAVAVRAIRSLD